MTSKPVEPLRIQKGTPLSSPAKMGSSIPRALSELAPTERRRNSPSFRLTTPMKTMPNADSSPFQSSPFDASEGNSSPRLFWQGRDTVTPTRFRTENAAFSQQDTLSSPTRRSSIERLQRASRVKNSNMFAREQKQEYDPTSVPVVERPLAKQVQGNAYGGSGLDGLRSEERGRPQGYPFKESRSNIPIYTSAKIPLSPNANGLANARSPNKDQVSPMKSSLSQGRFNPKSNYDPENGTWSADDSGDERVLPEGRSLHRHAKSVTFDAAPPQVNEYELVTPDLSSIGTGSRENSYESGEDDDENDSYVHGDPVEREDSFDASLEDINKTPVVGPDDWRHGLSSPQNADGAEGITLPVTSPSSPSTVGPKLSHQGSQNETGDHRPLPPLPGIINTPPSKGLTAAAERASGVQRGLPSPPSASAFSKSDIQGFSSGKMPLEERLRLMMIQEDDKPKSAAELQRERRLRRGGPRELASQSPERDHSQISIHEDEDTLGELGEYQLPSRISRESILRKVNGQDSSSRDLEYDFSSAGTSPERSAQLDPDVAIPSTEDISIVEDAEDSVIIKREEDEEEFDVYSIPGMHQGRPESRIGDYERDESVIRHELRADDDDVSEYSEPAPADKSRPVQEEIAALGVAMSPKNSDPPASNEQDRLSLPDISGSFNSKDFGLSLQSYMSPSPPAVPTKEELGNKELPSFTQSLDRMPRPLTPPQEKHLKSGSLSKPEYDGTGWGSDEEGEDFGTPDSVLHRPQKSEPQQASPIVPDQVATIKASSGPKLKTRPSATPADIAAMREVRRQVSGETPSVPPIPEKHRNRRSFSMDQSVLEISDEDDGRTELARTEISKEDDQRNELARISSFKKKSLTLDIGNDLGLSLDEDFDRVIEAQKVAFDLSLSHPTLYNSGPRQVSFFQAADHHQIEINANITPRKQRGYLMRQNTKLVVASSDDKFSDNSRGYRSAGNSPVKKERPQSWVVEPWQTPEQKQSSKELFNPNKKIAMGPVPPMPGHQSNVAGLSILAEEEHAADQNECQAGERGRLFVKVVSVKDLDLPLPKSERSWFSLTLDNGVHCVTTAWLELGKNAPIGQEFELVVPNDLEFQLTLNAKLEKPEPKRVVESPTKSVQLQKSSTFSRVFTSPKKRKELEMRQKEEEQRLAMEKQKDLEARRKASQPTTWDLLSPLSADDGSFGRSYVSLKDHESQCYGRPYVVDVACFNEWATEEATASSSVKAKRGNTHVQRRAPYKVGKLELQLLFVPKPNGAKDEDMPKSMNSCIREMKEAELTATRNWEGFLSQQGGDCPYWRRRFFRLMGSKLTAYHETSGQPRATINLANASKLIDDRRLLSQRETTGKGGSRRKSGFAEEEEGYMFIEEGFRIRFSNGEVIDFYADTGKDKEGCMKVLDQCIGAGDGKSSTSSWCTLVLRREEAIRRKQIRKASGDKQLRKASGDKHMRQASGDKQVRQASGEKARHHTRVKSMIL